MLEIELAKELISRKSITPSDGGCLKFTADYLEKLGFQNEFMPFEDVDNIWSVYDNGGPLLFFLGHVDVVPTGPEKLWTHDPFAAVEDEKFIPLLDLLNTKNLKLLESFPYKIYIKLEK